VAQEDPGARLRPTASARRSSSTGAASTPSRRRRSSGTRRSCSTTTRRPCRTDYDMCDKLDLRRGELRDGARPLRARAARRRGGVHGRPGAQQPRHQAPPRGRPHPGHQRESIDRAEDRQKFSVLLDEPGDRPAALGAPDGRLQGPRPLVTATSAASRCWCARATCSRAPRCAWRTSRTSSAHPGPARQGVSQDHPVVVSKFEPTPARSRSTPSPTTARSCSGPSASTSRTPASTRATPRSCCRRRLSTVPTIARGPQDRRDSSPRRSRSPAPSTCSSWPSGERCGHRVQPPRVALVPLRVQGDGQRTSSREAMRRMLGVRDARWTTARSTSTTSA
jgi:hypothetical protein